MKQILSIILFLVAVATENTAQTVFKPTDIEIFEELMHQAKMENQSYKNINEIVALCGKYFIGTPYVAKTLEINIEEKLVVNLRELDCTTYLENMIVLARLIKQDKTTFEAYCNELENLRYRNGKVNKYPSRLHYFSDWLFENQRKGIVKNMTQEIGGIPYVKSINFMSAHYKKYKQLGNPEFLKEIKNTEEQINEREYYYIPKKEVEKHINKIKSGDLIAITTTIKGLDIVHVGFAVAMNNTIYFMHASPEPGVILTNEPLSKYLQRNKLQSGIMVARLNEVKNENRE